MKQMFSEKQVKELIQSMIPSLESLLEKLPGFDDQKEQMLVNSNGTLMWVDAPQK